MHKSTCLSQYDVGIIKDSAIIGPAASLKLDAYLPNITAKPKLAAAAEAAEAVAGTSHFIQQPSKLNQYSALLT